MVVEDGDDEAEGDDGSGQRDDRDDEVHGVSIVEPPFPGGPQDMTLLSKYVKHVAVAL